MLDESLLEEATRRSGERTCSDTVKRALDELVCRLEKRELLDLAHTGSWKGDLAAMRDDRGAKPRTR